MDEFEKKYGFKEGENVKYFHRSRRMFCIHQGRLHIAEPDVSYSHATWFEKEGWMTKENDDFINKTTRGIIDAKGDVYFYIGWNFQLIPVIEKEFFPHLGELASKLRLDMNSKVFGGLKKGEVGTIWPAIKDYGIISTNLKR